jgi:uncharacterized protein
MRFIGVVHLGSLPGAPVAGAGIEAVVARARADARALVDGGVDGLIVENLGDAPFAAEHVGSPTVAMMTRAVMEVRQEVGRLPVGVNVLRNDAVAAMSVAAATGAGFIRVNVYVGAMVTDQGLIQGAARQTLQTRRILGADAIDVAADVMVKHASPLGNPRIQDLARDAWHRGRASQLIVSGSGTGHPTDPSDVRRVREAVPEAVIWIGSGITPDTVASYPDADGFIVGTWLHRKGVLTAPVDPQRVRAMGAAIQAAKS